MPKYEPNENNKFADLDRGEPSGAQISLIKKNQQINLKQVK